jgi:hypothetical protein
MSNDNTQDANEPSPESAGSHSNAVLWALEWREDAGRLDPEWVYDNLQWANEVNATGCYGRATVIPLYRQPQPTLTDEEREAVEELSILATEHRPNSDRVKGYSYTVERLLRRTK